MSDSNYNGGRQAPAGSSNVSMTNDDASGDEISFAGTNTFELKDGNLTEKAKAARKRKKFEKKRREEVALVRRFGACPECKKRKVACKHVLPVTASNTDSSPKPPATPESISAPHPLKTDPDFNINEQFTKTDDIQKLNEPLPYDVDIPGTASTPSRRPEAVAQQIRDFDHIYSNASQWPQNEPYWTDMPFPPGGEQYSNPSAANNHSYPTVPYDTDLHAYSSTPTNNNLVSSYGQDVTTYQCDVKGCDNSTVFTGEVDFRHHQELHHANQYQEGTYPCRFDECQPRRYGRQELLDQHIKLQHPQIGGGPTSFPLAEPTQDEVHRGKIDQFESFLAGGYVPGMNDGLSNPAYRPPINVDVESALFQKLRVTPSSRGARSVAGQSQGITRPYRKASVRRDKPSAQREHPSGPGYGRLSDQQPFTGNFVYSPTNNMQSVDVNAQFEVMETDVEPMNSFTGTTFHQQMQQSQSPYFSNETISEFEPYPPSLATGSRSQGFTQLPPMWGAITTRTIGQGQNESFVTEHTVTAQAPEQNYQSSSPLGFVTPDAYGACAYASQRIGTDTSSGRLYSRQHAPSSPQLYCSPSGFQHSEFGADAISGGYSFAPPQSSQPPEQHPYGLASSFPPPASHVRGHNRQPSITLNDREIIYAPIDPPDFDFIHVQGDHGTHAQLDRNASYPYNFPALEPSNSFTGSYSSSQNESLTSLANPTQATNIRQPHAINNFDSNGLGISAGAINIRGKYALVAPIGNEKQIGPTVTSMAMQSDGDDVVSWDDNGTAEVLWELEQ